MLLRDEMKKRIGYFIEKVNDPLAKAIIFYANRYPEPTRENVVYNNCLILFDIEDKFFECWKTSPRTPLFRALFKILKVKYAQSANWRNFLDWFLAMVKASGWKPFNPNRQMACWKGGGHGFSG